MTDLANYVRECPLCIGGYHEPSAHVMTAEDLAACLAGPLPDKPPGRREFAS